MPGPRLEHQREEQKKLNSPLLTMHSPDRCEAVDPYPFLSVAPANLQTESEFLLTILFLLVCRMLARVYHTQFPIKID